MSDDLCFLTLAEATAAMRCGQLTSLELVEAFIDRFERVGEGINCYGTFLAERSRAQARALDDLRKTGVDLGPIHGIPIAVKDNIDTAGIATTSGSPIWRNRVPVRDSALASRLYSAGAVIIGKSNLYEWAYGAPSTLFGDVANPWDAKLTSGASSNGSAAAVAAGLATAAIGTDLGGSIRIPAAMCGVFGLKPTFGSVSRRGVFPPGQTLDHIGPLTRTAHDANLLMAGISDAAAWPPRQGRDSNSPAGLGMSARGLRVGIARPQEAHPVDANVQGCLDSTRSVFENLGCKCEQIDLPDFTDARTAMWTISAVEGAEAHLPMMQDHLHEYAEKPRRLLLAGLVVPAVDYVRAQRVRAAMTQEMNRIFMTVDVVLSPVIPTAPWSASIKTIEIHGVQEDNMAAMTHFTPLYNLTGQPAASFLAGFTPRGVPLSLQLASSATGVERLLHLVGEFEAITEFTSRRPPEKSGQDARLG